MKVLGLISSAEDAASRIRIVQYTAPLALNNIKLSTHFFNPLKETNPPNWAVTLKKITGISEWRSFDLIKSGGRLPVILKQYGYDIIWQNRLLHLYHSFWENKIKKPVVFDFDDAIWINEGKRQVNKKLLIADMIFAGNEYLADYASAFNSNIQIVPSTINIKKTFSLNKNNQDFIIGWIGSPSNFQYLELIKPAILEFILKHDDAKFMIISSEPPELFKFDGQKIFFNKWTLENENNLINNLSIGIMPLTDTDWTRGKCSYKLLQYLACGKPAVFSPVGMNNKINAEATIGLTANNSTEWLNAFIKLKEDRSFYNTCSANGVQLINEKYSTEVWSNKIANLFRQII